MIRTLHRIAFATALLSALAGAQTPPPGAPVPGAADAAKSQEALRRAVADLRSQVDALTKRVDALAGALAELSRQAVIDVPIDSVTDYFAGAESNMQPQVIASYPGRLVSASIVLVRTERYGGTEAYSNGRSVVVTPGGSAAIPVEGAGAPCHWVVYDEHNTIKVRSERCSYLSPGLRGYFSGAIYYKQR
jgi:hypothetical protein